MDGAKLDAIRGLEGLGTRTDPAARKAVAREFEALLVGEMTKIANKPVFGEPVLGGGSSSRMWQEMFLEQVVRQGAGRFGIAEAAFPTTSPGANPGDAGSENPGSARNVREVAPPSDQRSRTPSASESLREPPREPAGGSPNEVSR